MNYVLNEKIVKIGVKPYANRLYEYFWETVFLLFYHLDFLLLKMKVEFEDGYEPQKVMPEVLQSCRKIESDCEIYF